MDTRMRGVAALPVLILLAAAGSAMMHAGVYGWTLFVALPVLLGELAAWVFRPTTAMRAAGLGAITALAATFFFCRWGWKALSALP